MRRRFLFFTGFFIYSLLFQIPVVSTIGVNRSIDDTLGDSVTGKRPTFLPGTAGVWEDNTCSGCALAPDVSKAFDQTYTAATYNPDLNNISISFDFTGTAIYVFFILSNDGDPDISSSTKANFTLDGTLASTFTHTPDTSTSAPDFYFNESALAFSKTGMKNISHQMVISTSGLSSNFYLNFDYALYTFPDPAVTTTSSSATSTSTSTTTASSTSSSSSTPIGAIVGGAIGGLAALVALIAGLLFCYRRKYPKEKHHEDDPNSVFHREIDPFILPAPGPISAAVESSFTDNPSRPASTHPSAFPSSSGRSMITSMVPSTAGLGVGTTAASSALSPLAMATDSKSALRVQRQQELERQMQQIQHQMLDLQNEAAERNFDIGGANGSTVNLNSSQSRATSVRRSVRSPDGTEKSEDVSHLKAQIQAMSEHIAILQDQRDNSEWAQGISDEPPPGYSPAAPSPV